jgi:ribose 5-phosphate isomerase B
MASKASLSFDIIASGIIASPMADLTGLNLITEEDIRSAAIGATLHIGEKALVTPLAADLARERHIILERTPVAAAKDHGQSRRIAVGADHGGFEMKEALKKVLDELGCKYRDFGTTSTAAVDYPDFAQAVALAVARGSCDLGIMIDGAGIGSCMVANKVPGVRAAMCYDEASARNSREHNGANVLTLGGKTISNARMREIVLVWLSTDLTEERHRRRVAKIDALR